jgi:hypothetical protein
MKSLIIAVVASAAVVAFAAGPAYASAIRECGNHGWTDDGYGPAWTYGPISGASPAYNLTTRRVSCRAARRFALRYRGTDTYFPRWRCREVNDYEWSDVRCTASGGRVIRWQAGS